MRSPPPAAPATIFSLLYPGRAERPEHPDPVRRRPEVAHVDGEHTVELVERLRPAPLRHEGILLALADAIAPLRGQGLPDRRLKSIEMELQWFRNRLAQTPPEETKSTMSVSPSLA